MITKEIEHENIDIINFKCHECNFTGDNLSDLKSHLVKVHPKMVYMCDKCNYVGATSSNVRDHYRSMHRGILYSCQNCEYSSKRPGTVLVIFSVEAILGLLFVRTLLSKWRRNRVRRIQSKVYTQQ